MNLLEIKDLTKKFGNFIAVDHISFSIKEGEIFGFLGTNGAGKTTTIQMIAGLLQIHTGEILFMGKDSTKHRSLTKKNIGLVPQEIAIYEELTAYENVQFFAGLYGLRGVELQNRVNEALDFVGLSDKKKENTKNFSGGMKRRLNIACAIAHQPKLLIMDEPTVGIDPQSRNYILNSVKTLNQKGCTILYTSHYMEEVEEICSRIAIIDHGKIIAEGTKEELTTIITDTKEVWIEVKSTEQIKREALEEIAGVKRVHMEGNQIQIHSEKEVNNLNLIIQFFINHDLEIQSLKEQAPNLETVFLTLTGRSLRDQ